MRALGIDYGEVRTGFAISDELGITAVGLGTVNINNNDKLFVKTVLDYVRQYSIDNIVLGYPKHMNGDISKKAQKIELLAERIDNTLRSNGVKDFNITLYDERLTTVASHKLMTELKVKTKDKKQIVDTIAAVYILQGYLDGLANKNI